MVSKEKILSKKVLFDKLLIVYVSACLQSSYLKIRARYITVYLQHAMKEIRNMMSAWPSFVGRMGLKRDYL